MRKSPVFTSERVENLQLPLIALAVWAIAPTLVGLPLGYNFWVVGLLVGALIGGYAAFGRGPIAVLLRWPAVGVAFGISFLGGGR